MLFQLSMFHKRGLRFTCKHTWSLFLNSDPHAGKFNGKRYHGLHKMEIKESVLSILCYELLSLELTLASICKSLTLFRLAVMILLHIHLAKMYHFAAQSACWKKYWIFACCNKYWINALSFYIKIFSGYFFNGKNGALVLYYILLWRYCDF